MSSQRTQTYFYPRTCMRAGLSRAFNGARINEAVCLWYLCGQRWRGWVIKTLCRWGICFVNNYLRVSHVPRADERCSSYHLVSFWLWWWEIIKYLCEYLIAHIMSTVAEVTRLLFGENNGMWRSVFDKVVRGVAQLVLAHHVPSPALDPSTSGSWALSFQLLAGGGWRKQDFPQLQSGAGVA